MPHVAGKKSSRASRGRRPRSCSNPSNDPARNPPIAINGAPKIAKNVQTVLSPGEEELSVATAIGQEIAAKDPLAPPIIAAHPFKATITTSNAAKMRTIMVVLHI